MEPFRMHLGCKRLRFRRKHIGFLPKDYFDYKSIHLKSPFICDGSVIFRNNKECIIQDLIAEFFKMHTELTVMVILRILADLRNQKETMLICDLSTKSCWKTTANKRGINFTKEKISPPQTVNY